MFDLKKYLIFIFIFLISEIFILIMFPLEIKTNTDIYNYDTKINERLSQISYAPIIINSLIGIIILFFALTFKEAEPSILRSIVDILHDSNATKELSAMHILPTSPILHDQIIGDFPEGKLKLAHLENTKGAEVFCIYIANDNYNKTETRDRFKSPIIDLSYHYGNIINAIEMKPSTRSPEASQLKRAIKIQKEKPYLNQKVEDEIEEEEGYYE